MLSLQDTTATTARDSTEQLPARKLASTAKSEGLTRFESINVRYTVKGRSLQVNSHLFSAYRWWKRRPDAVSGDTDVAGNRWETRNLKGKVGNSDIAGNVVVTPAAPSPILNTTLNSDLARSCRPWAAYRQELQR